jgi:hypothetical protein
MNTTTRAMQQQATAFVFAALMTVATLGSVGILAAPAASVAPAFAAAAATQSA